MLAQYDKTHKMYFQYSNESLVGFVLDGKQYFYLTNLKGDIVGIADETGSIIAQYSYDEWGKLLSVSADSEENKALAELNPFRYRGYYYDNETGMYYLNSRYYNPELCRFISADGFSYISNNEKLSLNAYLYCWSNPVTFEDKEGTTPQLSLNVSDLVLFIKNLNAKIKESAESKIQALKDKCEGIRRNIERTLKLHYNAFIDKLEFAINNPDVVINTALSKLLNKEVNIRFRLVEYIREKFDVYISLSKLKADIPLESSSEGEAITRAKTKSKKVNKYVSELGQTISVLIVEIFTCLDLQEIAKELKLDFSFDSLEDYMQKKVEIYTAWFESNLWTAATDFADTLAGYISLAADFVPIWEVKAALTVLPYATSVLNDFSGKYISPKGGLIMLLYDWSTNLASSLLGKNTSMGDLILEAIMGTVFGEIFDFFDEKSAINYAYNWYLM